MSDWLRDFYREVDKGNIDSFPAYCAADVMFLRGGAPPVRGLVEVMEAQRAFLSTIRSLSHEFVNVFTDGDTSVLEATVTYTRLDGRAVEVPSVTILHRTGGLVDSIRVYLDIAPVYAEVGQVAELSNEETV
ncbi:nuclear transport factor 2 family protein [Amycolatopsis sp. lyj-90]|uniref:nuclear transport factor 2 family protein n=1 Tax=Amycolatopsis sp. lyj-90 TaxID=2789285 RepID=UPI00397BB9CD